MQKEKRDNRAEREKRDRIEGEKEKERNWNRSQKRERNREREQNERELCLWSLRRNSQYVVSLMPKTRRGRAGKSVLGRAAESMLGRATQSPSHCRETHLARGRRRAGGVWVGGKIFEPTSRGEERLVQGREKQ